MTLVQVLFFVNSGDMAAVITLGLIGFLTSFFSKNMIVIMFVALTVSSLLQYGIRANTHEGLENKEEPQEPKIDEPAPENEKKPEEKPEEKTPKTEETEEFVEVQKQILAGVEKMEPLLQKAEAFMDKYQTKK
jgi:outer membrane biosynthesis protein TonB